MMATFVDLRTPLRRWWRPGAVAVVGALVGAVCCGPARAADFIGHQALYGISLVSADAKSGIISASGAVLYRFADACDGWTTENRTLLRLSYEEGDGSETEWSQITWESKDGSKFRFRVRDIEDGEMSEELQGQASLTRAGTGIARFVKPDRSERQLPKGTLFPTHHLMALLKAAHAGKRFLTNTVFDGASLDNPYLVGAAFGKVPPSLRHALARKAKLVDLPMWHLRLAFFPVADTAPTPKFEIGINLREDGIADDIVQDFGDFVLRLTLQHIEILPKPDC